MTGTTPELVAACWTTAGAVAPLAGRTASPLDVRERVEATAAAGYTGFGMTHEDLVAAREQIGLDGVARSLREHGITTVQLERLSDWWTTGERRRAADRARRDLFEACPVLGVDNIKVGTDDASEPVSRDRLGEDFAALCSEAEEFGVRIGLENTPFSWLITTTEQAVAFVTEVGHRNGGLVVDVWHAYRGGTPYGLIADRLPLQHLFGVELDDAAALPVGSLYADTFDNRVVCGQGDFDVPEFITQMRRIGWTGPWGVEHMSEESRRLPVRDVLDRARDGVLACFAEADRREQQAAAG